MILTRALQNSFRPVLRPTFPACNSLKCSSITPSLFSTKVSPSSGDKAKKSSSVSAAKKVPAVVKTKKATAAAAAAVVKEDSPGKKKAAVAAKPPPPKRALSAYSLFLRNEYNKVKEQSPNLKFVEISKKLSDLWKELPNDQKSRYLREAEKAHAVAKSKEGPKPPPNAYAVFAKEVYKVSGVMGMVDVFGTIDSVFVVPSYWHACH